MRPPMALSLSMISESMPRCLRKKAAAIPEAPPPTTIHRPLSGIMPFLNSPYSQGNAMDTAAFPKTVSCCEMLISTVWRSNWSLPAFRRVAVRSHLDRQVAFDKLHKVEAGMIEKHTFRIFAGKLRGRLCRQLCASFNQQNSRNMIAGMIEEKGIIGIHDEAGAKIRIVFLPLRSRNHDVRSRFVATAGCSCKGPGRFVFTFNRQRAIRKSAEPLKQSRCLEAPRALGGRNLLFIAIECVVRHKTADRSIIAPLLLFYLYFDNDTVTAPLPSRSPRWLQQGDFRPVEDKSMIVGKSEK